MKQLNTFIFHSFITFATDTKGYLLQVWDYREVKQNGGQDEGLLPHKRLCTYICSDFNQIHIVCPTETGPFPVETLKCIESRLPKNKRHRFAPMHVSVSVVTNTHKCFKLTHLSASRAPLKTETPKCVRVMHGCITSKHQVFGFWYRALDALKCFTMKRLCLWVYVKPTI